MTLAEWEALGYRYAVGIAHSETDPALQLAAVIRSGEITGDAVDQRIAVLESIGRRSIISQKAKDFLIRAKGLSGVDLLT